MKKITLISVLIVLVSLSFSRSENAIILRGHANDKPFTSTGTNFSDLKKVDTLKTDTLRSSKNEVENTKEEISELANKGRVSWYGEKFQGRYTSSGEKFDMNELTAAHKKLPFGTRVKIRNPENGKEVIVRITDRGPFSPKREFDLSKAAFEQLASLGTGILNVTYEVL